MTCPKCKTENTDNWPDGLCQECWEAECDRIWWDTVIAIDTYLNEGVNL